MKITRCTPSGSYAINTSSKTWNAAHSPRLTPQAQIVAVSSVSGRPRYITTAHQYSIAARASQPITLTNSTVCRPRGTLSGSITWLIHCLFPETHLNDCGNTPRTSSPSRMLVATTTLNHAAQKSRLIRLIPNNVIRSSIPISCAITVSTTSQIFSDWLQLLQRVRPFPAREGAAEFFTVFSTVCESFAAKPCNSAQRGANPKQPQHLASAMICKAVKRCAIR